MKIKKYLSFTALRTMVSDRVRSWRDSRREKSTSHSLHDAVMSGLACMYFQEPLLLQFQTEMESKYPQNNLRTLFDVKTIPSANAMKAILDNQDSEPFQPIAKNIVQRLQRGKQLKQFDLLAGLKVCSMDATQYHTLQSIRCGCYLTANKDNDDKPTRYYHTALQAAIMHPDRKQVIPIGVEPIQNGDGAKKQDCETNAVKRLIPRLRQLGLIITGDDLFSRQPMMKTVLENHFDYFFVAKEKNHPFMMTWLETHRPLNEVKAIDEKGRTVIYQWMNGIPLNGAEETIKVNFFQKKPSPSTLGENKYAVARKVGSRHWRSPLRGCRCWFESRRKESLESGECAVGTRRSDNGSVTDLCRSDGEDGGRSAEVGYQEQASNHLKRLLLKVTVVSVEEKLIKNQQVGFRKTSHPEPLLTRR